MFVYNACVTSHVLLVFRFLETVQSLPMDAVHYFSVKLFEASVTVLYHLVVFLLLQDKKEHSKWLGIGLDGVMQFNHEDKKSHTTVCYMLLIVSK